MVVVRVMVLMMVLIIDDGRGPGQLVLVVVRMMVAMGDG